MRAVGGAPTHDGSSPTSQLDACPAVGNRVSVDKIAAHLIIKVNRVHILCLQWNRCACVLDALKSVVSDGISAVGPGATRVPRACIARLSTKLGKVVPTKSAAISTPKHPGVWGTIHSVVLKSL